MRAIKLCRIGGTDIMIHPAFPLLAIAAMLLGQWSVTRAMLLALVMHECGHMVAAKAVGLNVPEMEFAPFGGVAKIERLTESEPWRETVVALMGPAVNLLAIMAAAFGAHQMGWWTGEAAQTFIRCNIALMAINMIPVLPLDGGRAARAILGRFVSRTKATKVFAWAGVALGGAAVCFGAYMLTKRQINLTLLTTGAYLVYSALGERDQSLAGVVRTLSRRSSDMNDSGVVPTSWLSISADTHISKITPKLRGGQYTMISIVDPRSMSVIGTVSEGDLLSALAKDQTMTAGSMIAAQA